MQTQETCYENSRAKLRKMRKRGPDLVLESVYFSYYSESNLKSKLRRRLKAGPYSRIVVLVNEMASPFAMFWDRIHSCSI